MDQYGNPYPQPGYPPQQGFPHPQQQLGQGWPQQQPMQQPYYPQQQQPMQQHPQQPAYPQGYPQPGYPPQQQMQQPAAPAPLPGPMFFNFTTIPESEFATIPDGFYHIVVDEIAPENDQQTGKSRAVWKVRVLQPGPSYGHRQEDSITFDDPNAYPPDSAEQKQAIKSMQKAKMCLKRLFDLDVDSGAIDFSQIFTLGLGKQAIAEFKSRTQESKKNPGQQVTFQNINFGGYQKPDGFQYILGPGIPPPPRGTPTQYLAGMGQQQQQPAAPAFEQQQLPMQPPPQQQMPPPQMPQQQQMQPSPPHVPAPAPGGPGYAIPPQGAPAAPPPPTSLPQSSPVQGAHNYGPPPGQQQAPPAPPPQNYPPQQQPAPGYAPPRPDGMPF